MVKQPRVLIIDDDAVGIIFLDDLLKHKGYQVLVARNGKDGLRQARVERPDLVILDITMPGGIDGYEVCRQLKDDPETRSMCILMLTASGQLQHRVKGLRIGADDFLAKPYEKDELEARVEGLLKRVPSLPFPPSKSDCHFWLSYTPRQRLSITMSGVSGINAVTDGTTYLDVEAYARLAYNTPLNDWRFNSKDVGSRLYKSLFIDQPEVLSNYKEALGEIGLEKLFHLHFTTDRNALRLPFEFLFEDNNGIQDYLVLRHPLSRTIAGVRRKRSLISPDFLNGLYQRQKVLQILLIASNTLPVIPAVDREIGALHRSLKEIFEEQGIEAQVEVLYTEEATSATVRKILKGCSYDIIHYAGHGFHNEESPEKSYLAFWEKPNRQGTVQAMTIADLQILLRGSMVRFAYLSCCLSSASSGANKLLDDSFLGISDGLVQAGVPAVLGFRWPVDDRGAQRLALSFYRSLAQQGQLDTALLDARCEIAAQDRDDITWLSPVLIMQA